MELIGREKEMLQLDKVKASRKSEFVALYGRRRVGKTYLVCEYFEYQFDFQLTGLANSSTHQQLVNFHTTLLRQSKSAPDQVPQTWFMAFQHLMDHLEGIQKESKLVVFLDELPWLDTPKSDFMIALEHFWNSWATNRKDVILLACGSAASWVINELINNHGGLHNRVTERIKIHPFTLRETEQMLQTQNSVLDRYQILQLYMVTGGIPYYLDAISPAKSAAQNIEELCFRQGSLLVQEFHNLYSSLFRHAEKHERVVLALSSKAKGMNRNELAKAASLSSGGGLTKVLSELEESGFISRYSLFGKAKQTVLYRLSDFYSLFYFKFIKDNTNYEPGVWVNALDHPAQRAWAGFAFEQVCLAHIEQIKKALGISGVLTSSSVWESKDDHHKTQIDLVIDRRDQVVNLCEAKFSINPYTITKSYTEQLRNKMGIFRQETRTRKALFLTFITTYGLARNEHATGLVQNEVTMDDLFV